MIAITALLFPLGLLASEKYITHRVKAYIAWFLLLEGAIMGIFLALDLILFFVFWELMLVPMYFLIQGWGSGRREFAAMKFFIYTAAGSAFLLASTLALAFIHKSDTGFLTFDFRVLAAWNGLSGTTEVVLFLGFLAAFAIKAPLFPFHTWLPLVHTEAPTAGSVVLAGVILKMGAYGLIRFSFELFPQAAVDLAPMLLVLAVIGIIYGAIVATMQTRHEARHRVLVGRAHGLRRARHLLAHDDRHRRRRVHDAQPPAHHRRAVPHHRHALRAPPHPRDQRVPRHLEVGAGARRHVPHRARSPASGCPGFSGFIGEFLSLLGTFIYDQPYAIVATFGVILAAVYSLWVFQRAFTGKPRGENAKMRDISVREFVVVAPLLALSLFLGLYPKPALDRIEPTVKAKIARLEQKTDYREPKPPTRREDRRAGRVEVILAVTATSPRRTSTGSRSRPSSRSVAPRCSSCWRVRCCAGAPRPRRSGYALAAAGIITAGVMLFWQWQRLRDHGPISTMTGMVRVDGFGVFLGVIIVSATALALLVAVSYMKREGLETPEYLALMLFSSLGMVAMTTANNLIVIFIALEILSIPLYVLAAFDRRRLSSQEAGIKYFVLGAFSSAIFLYGIALVYGATGTTLLDGTTANPGIFQFLAQNTLFEQGTLLAGIGLLARRPRVQGVGGSVPHVDARRLPGRAHARHRVHGRGHQGRGIRRPHPRVLHRVPALPHRLATGGVGARGAHARGRQHRHGAPDRHQADARVLVDRACGLRARRVPGRDSQGREAALFYLLVYSFMVLGSFAVVTALSLKGDADHTISSYRGLAFRHPVLGSLLVFFMLAQAGIPLTGGFIAKVEVFEAASAVNEYALVAIAAVATVVASFGYLRVALSAAYPDASEPTPTVALHRRFDVYLGLALLVAFGMTLALGVVPEPFVHWARDASFLF